MNKLSWINARGRIFRGRQHCVALALLLGLVGLGTPGSAAGSAVNATVSISSVASRWGFQSWHVSGKKAILLGRFNTLILERDSRRAEYNDTVIWLNGPVSRRWGRWVMPTIDEDKVLRPIFSPSAVLGAAGYRTVVLDPGHGGDDKGASNARRGLEEKRVTLELARKVRTILQKYQVDVRLTRSTDRTIALENRCALADSWEADLFLSIHLNSAENRTSTGIETYIVPPAGCPSTANASATASDWTPSPANRYDSANMVFGYILHRALLKYTRGEDRGVRRARFMVIKNVHCPAALVECGFISNRAEAGKLLDDDYRDVIARGIAEGILSYLNTVKRAHKINP